MQHYHVLSVVLLLWAHDHCVSAKGAGRAFPIESENYVIAQFTSVNPNIEWDESNFLVDLSGLFANCKWIGTRGFVNMIDTTRLGISLADDLDIGAIVDYTDGDENHVGAVHEYLMDILDTWMFNQAYLDQIKKATRFGCSVRPGCNGEVSMGCLFTPSSRGNPHPPTPRPRPNPIYRTTTTSAPYPRPQPIFEGKQYALAFTREQYDLAEVITGKAWDSSHFLENLSGYETNCSMIGKSRWGYRKMTEIADERGLNLIGKFGYARHHGDNTKALAEILEGFEAVSSTEIGCSVIPECPAGFGAENQMYSVLCCIYKDGARPSYKKRGYERSLAMSEDKNRQNRILRHRQPKYEQNYRYNGY